MKHYECDQCHNRLLERDQVIVLNPSQYDVDTTDGVEPIHICFGCMAMLDHDVTRTS